MPQKSKAKQIQRILLFCRNSEVIMAYNIFCKTQEKLQRYGSVLKSTKSLNSLFTVYHFRVLEMKTAFSHPATPPHMVNCIAYNTISTWLVLIDNIYACVSFILYR